jgi:hypothetical protein
VHYPGWLLQTPSRERADGRLNAFQRGDKGLDQLKIGADPVEYQKRRRGTASWPNADTQLLSLYIDDANFHTEPGHSAESLAMPFIDRVANVVADDLDGQRCVFLAGLHHSERDIAEKLRGSPRGSPISLPKPSRGNRERNRKFVDSPLEEDGFELVVPLSKRTAVPSSPFGFPALSARATGSYDPQTVTYDAARGSALAQIRAAAFVVPGDA